VRSRPCTSDRIDLRYAALALALAGCMRSNAVSCGDGVCEVGDVCTPGGCATPTDVAACAGLAEGAPCETSGSCELGACRSRSWVANAVVGGSHDVTTADLVPTAVATALGNVYIADDTNHRIRRVDAAGVITTVAGTGEPGFSGDGGAATNAQLHTPSGIAVDGLGRIYIADTFNNRIRRVDVAGVITTVAGTGIAGFSGDGGPARIAQLYYPQGVAVDGLGRLFIADSGNQRIRRVDTSGAIATVAGNGSAGFSGDGGAATSAQLYSPYGVAVDGLGSVFVADTDNNVIRRVDASGIITTVAGNASPGFSGDGGAATSAQLYSPYGVAVDGIGRLYIADRVNFRVRRVDVAGVITTVAGMGSGVPGGLGDGGAATSAQLYYPQGVAVDGLGSFYIADTSNFRVRRVDFTGIITTVAGSGVPFFLGNGGAATSAQLSLLSGVAVGGLGDLYIADTFNNMIRRVDSAGVITTVAGTGAYGFSGDGGAATSAQLAYPFGVAVDGLGSLYIADGFNHRIRKVDSAGVITTVAGTGVLGFSGDGGAATSAQLNYPFDVALDGLGTLYIADTKNHCIRRVDTAGVITTVAGTGVLGFSGDGGAATSAQLHSPYSVAVDGLGNLFIADGDNERIRRVDTAGVITTVAGTGTPGFTGDGGAATNAELDSPLGVTVDGLGRVYIGDRDNHVVRRIDAAGVITTVAGTGTPGFTGDGGAATSAQLDKPFGVAVDGSGRLYIADQLNLRVRRVDTAGVISTPAGEIAPEGMGPLAQARFAGPRAMIASPPVWLVAGGTSGTVQLARTDTSWVGVVAGRYPQLSPAGDQARYRDQNFGNVSGIAYDAAAGLIYLSESPNLVDVSQIDVVTTVDPADPTTWTITRLVGGASGFADGDVTTARFAAPAGLYLDSAEHALYVADTGNHAVRRIDLATTTVTTIAGNPTTAAGFAGDGGPATAAVLSGPEALIRCRNGDLFIADTGNSRIRRIDATTGIISTVLGEGTFASSGEGAPATIFPVDRPGGLACDPAGNLFVTSTSTVRVVGANSFGVVDGTGTVHTIYGKPGEPFPATASRCLTGLIVLDATHVQVVDSCTGMLVELDRMVSP
jgi:sugar lactone lactonase YvrE